jgi:PAS domain S-box-containing protein
MPPDDPRLSDRGESEARSVNIQTAILALAVGNFVFGLMLVLFQIHEERSRRIPFWTAAKFLQCVGWLFLAGRGTIPDTLSVLVGNFALLCGFAYECWAMYRISGRPVSRRLHASSAAGVAAVCVVLVFISSPSVRIVVASLVTAAFFALAGRATLTFAGSKSILRTYLGVIMWLMVTIMCARALWAALSPEGFALFTGNVVQIITFGFVYYMMLTSGFGILLLAKQRTDGELRGVLKEQRAILDTLPSGLCILRDRVIESCNPAMEAMFGYAPGTLQGQRVGVLYDGDDAFEDSGRRIYAAIEQSGRFEGEVAYVRRDGEPFWAWDQGTTIFPERAEAYSVFSITDITASK